MGSHEVKVPLFEVISTYNGLGAVPLRGSGVRIPLIGVQARGSPPEGLGGTTPDPLLLRWAVGGSII